MVNEIKFEDIEYEAIVKSIEDLGFKKIQDNENMAFWWYEKGNQKISVATIWSIVSSLDVDIKHMVINNIVTDIINKME